MKQSTAWRVSFDGSLYHQRGRAGQELRVDKTILWGDKAVYVPSVYLCGKGLVVDLLLRTDAEALRAFYAKWDLTPEHDGSDFTPEQWAQCNAENPLQLDHRAFACANRKKLRSCGASADCWSPLYPDAADKAMRAAMVHYGLDRACGWQLWRHRFRWATARRPELRSLTLTLCADSVFLPGPRFQIAPGASLDFTHPVTGAHHTLLAEALSPQTLPPEITERSPLGTQRLPTHYQALRFTLTPDLPDGSFQLRDTQPSDAPRLCVASSEAASAGVPVCIDAPAACVGIIGGEDGPTALFLSGDAPDGCHMAFSSLSHAPRGAVEWSLRFRHKPRPDCTISLLG